MMLIKRLILILISLLLAGSQLLALRPSSRHPNHFRNASLSSELLAPTPDDYMSVYEVACYGPSRSNTTGRQLTKQELVDYFSTSNNEPLKEVVAKYKIERECRREPTSWRFNYIDEMDQVLIREQSIDERAANVMYMVRAVKPFIRDIYTYDWGDPQLDEENMDQATGPHFDDDLCGIQLDQMLVIAEELNVRVGAMRANVTSSSSELNNQHISMARILDSYGRYESGSLYGKMYMPGAYYQCLASKLIITNKERVNMRYCWAHMSYHNQLAESLKTRERSRWENELDVLYAGVCIPESCHSKSFIRHNKSIKRLVDSQFKTPLSIYVNENMEMTSLYCLVDDDSKFAVPLAGKLLLAFIAMWSLLTLTITIWNRTLIGRSTSDVWQDDKNGPPVVSTRAGRFKDSILKSLDLLDSFKDFLTCYSKPNRPRAVQLDAMNFLKVFGCAFVVFGHTMALSGDSSTEPLRVAKFIENDWVCCLILAGTLVVDSFFVITGILWSYFTLKRLESSRRRKASPQGHLGANLSKFQQTNDLRQKLNSNNNDDERNSSNRGAVADPIAIQSTDVFNQQAVTVVREVSWPTTINIFCKRWLTYSTFRYLRIVPLYVLVHWFKKYVFIYVGRGPYWDHGFNKQSPNGACRFETPLTPFTFLAAYYPIAKQCTLQSWSIANDMFFSFLAPPIILLIYKRPKTALALSVVSCLLSYLFALDSMLKLPSQHDEELRELRAIGFYRFFDELSLLYTAPHFRVFNFVAGLWAGYALVRKQATINRKQQQHDIQAQANQQQAINDANNQICVEVSSRTQIKGTEEVAPQIEWPGWFKGIATKLSALYILGIMVGFGLNDNFKLISFGLHRLVYPQFVTSFRVFWSLANAVILLRMMTDWKDSLLMRWSASKFWQIFSKLNYAILLIHLDILLYTLYVSNSMQGNFSRLAFFQLGAGIFMLCIPLAVLVFVVFENPIDKLIRSNLMPRE